MGKNKGHMDYLEDTYSDLATTIKARLRRTGARVGTEAWNSGHQAEHTDIPLSLIN